MGKTKVLMEVSMVMNAINVIGNEIGVFVPRAGVAYPTMIFLIIAAAAMLFLATNRNDTDQTGFCMEPPDDHTHLWRCIGIIKPLAKQAGR